MIKIEHDLTYSPKLLHKDSTGYYFTYIDGIITNPHNGKKSIVTHQFIFDTGAAITILNSSFNFLFKDGDTPIIDHVNIHYGGGILKDPLPVYKVQLKIKGVEFEIPAAYDKNMKLKSLLGHFGFLNNLQHFGISQKKRKLTIIK